jgi:hypothetical protein
MVARLSTKIIETPRVKGFFKSRLLPGAAEILRVGGTEFPLLAGRTIGRGRVLVFTTSADMTWTDLPLHPLYFILVHEGLTCLARAPHEAPLTVGEPLLLPLPVTVEPGRVVLRDPDGRETELAPREIEGLRTVEYPGLDQPGFYQVVPPKPAAPLTLAVNLDPVESDVMALLNPAWTQRFAGLRARVLDNDGDLTEAIRASRVGFELWSYLVILAGALLVFESYLARRFSKVVTEAADLSWASGKAPRRWTAAPVETTSLTDGTGG